MATMMKHQFLIGSTFVLVTTGEPVDASTRTHLNTVEQITRADVLEWRIRIRADQPERFEHV